MVATVADRPTIITHFSGQLVDWHLRTYGTLPTPQCPLVSCQESQRENGKRRCQIDLPVCALSACPEESKR